MNQEALISIYNIVCQGLPGCVNGWPKVPELLELMEKDEEFRKRLLIHLWNEAAFQCDVIAACEEVSNAEAFWMFDFSLEALNYGMVMLKDYHPKEQSQAESRH